MSGEKSINAGYKELTQSKKVLKDLIETNIRQRGIGNPNPIKLGRCIKELERIYGVRDGSTNKQGTIVGENFSFTQKDLAKEIGIRMIPIRIREDLIDEDKKLKVLLAANFQRPKNSEAKQRKVADEYVRLCGYKNGEIGRNHSQDFQNGKAEKMTLEEIAKQLGTSKTNLTRALRIERNLTDAMKELTDKAG